MFGGSVPAAEEDRVFRAAVVHSVRSDRDAVVDRILDQQELGPGSHVARRHHRAHHDHRRVGAQERPRLLPQGFSDSITTCILSKTT